MWWFLKCAGSIFNSLYLNKTHSSCDTSPHWSVLFYWSWLKHSMKLNILNNTSAKVYFFTSSDSLLRIVILVELHVIILLLNSRSHIDCKYRYSTIIIIPVKFEPITHLPDHFGFFFQTCWNLTVRRGSETESWVKDNIRSTRRTLRYLLVLNRKINVTQQIRA